MALASAYTALRRGDWAAAREECLSLLAASPHSASAHHALGLTYCAEGAYEQAVEPLARAHALECDLARGRDLAIVYAQLRRWRDVVDTLQAFVEGLDECTLAIYLAAAIEIGEAEATLRAVEMCRRPAESADPDLRCEYGRALAAARRDDDALAVLRSCLDGPAASRACNELVALCERTGLGDLALDHSRELVRLCPDSAHAWTRLALMFGLRGRVRESREARLRAMDLGIDRPVDWSTALRLMLCDAHEDGLAIRDASVRAAHALGSSQQPSRPLRLSRRDGRLRVGYVSGEFHRPPASFFLGSFLPRHDRGSVEVFLYDTSRTAPAHAERIAHFGEHVRDASRLSDEDLAATVAGDDIDVLVDLSTHFPDNRLSLFTRRVAPVQAALPNCPLTTGCSEVDYLLTDRWTSPAGSESEYTETLHRLSSGYLIYEPTSACPPVGPLPALGNGFVTFGLIQQLMKLGADVWDAVAAVLRATPRSQLLLHNADGELARPRSETVRFLQQQLADRDVDPARMRIVGFAAGRDHLGLLNEIDVALDAWPFSGTTTTCECLWMGAPVVTRTGSTHASRVAAGLLQRIGWGEWIAADAPAWVATAVRIAADLEALAATRTALRSRCIDGGLADGRALAHELEQAYATWVSAVEARA
jgi:protein O-GlcNAc transferase